MCGIAGFIHANGRSADIAALRAMCDAIVHRGPDGEGLLAEGGAAIGMRRLAIIDVAGGNQPMHTDDGRHSIVFNGEVYNFQEERALLEKSGHRFHTRSDTEVVLRLFAEHGESCLERLRGMFAFAIWDRRDQRLFLARDRIGKKPLYFFTDGSTLLFGSEIKALMRGFDALGIPRPAVRRDALVDYVGLGYVPDPHTIWKGIEKLPPAHWLSFRGGAVTSRRWWHPPFAHAGSTPSETDALEQLSATLEEAVRLRLISDVPLGAYLSGGVDSSTVVALMKRVSTAPVRVFCVGFEDQEFDERPYARAIADRLEVSYEEFTVRADSQEVATAVARQFDEPFGDSSAIPTYYVSKMARQRVTVVLSGDGGDELFAGYPRYLKASAGGPLAKLPLGLRRAFGPLARALPAGMRGRARLLDLSLDDDGRYVFAATGGTSEAGASIFTPGFLRDVGLADPGRAIRSRLSEARGLDPITRRMYADTMLYLPGDIMTKVDRMSMMVSLEARAPLLDHKVVELAAWLPLGLKLRGGVQKYLLRKLAHRLLSPELIERRKHGFAVPVGSWINREWKPMADDHLATLLQRDVLAPAFVTRVLGEHRSGRRDHGELLWSLLALEIWFRANVR